MVLDLMGHHREFDESEVGSKDNLWYRSNTPVSVRRFTLCPLVLEPLVLTTLLSIRHR